MSSVNLGNKHEQIWAKIGEHKIWEENKVKLLGVTMDSKLRFDEHVTNLCNKTNRKLTALIRLVKFLSFEKKRILVKAFVESQFKYCPLVWMFHSRTLNKRINRLHERALRLIYNDYESDFDDLPAKDGSFCVHHNNLHALVIEIYKTVHGITEVNLNSFLEKNSDGPILRGKSDFKVPHVKPFIMEKPQSEI